MTNIPRIDEDEDTSEDEDNLKIPVNGVRIPDVVGHVRVVKEQASWVCKLIQKQIIHLGLEICRIIYSLIKAEFLSATDVIKWVMRIKVTYPMIGAAIIAIIWKFLHRIRHLSM